MACGLDAIYSVQAPWAILPEMSHALSSDLSQMRGDRAGLLLLLLAGCSTAPRSGELPPIAASPPATARLAQEVEAWVVSGDVVGAELIVIEGHDVLLHEAWGWADQERGQPMRPDGVISV